MGASGSTDSPKDFPIPVSGCHQRTANVSFAWLRTMSERGTMSIKKSNRSERAIALAMSERWMVRRLFSSATMNARQVRSEMKTGSASNHLLSQAREKRMGASAEIIWT